MKQTSKIFISLALIVSFSSSAFGAVSDAMAPKTDSKNTFTTGDKTFLLNGKPFVVKAAEIHHLTSSDGSWKFIG